MKHLTKWMLAAILLCGIIVPTSCGKADNPAEPEVTLEDAIKDGTIVAFTFNLNGVDITNKLTEEKL